MIRDQKKLVYWGTGRICQYCLEQHQDYSPLFFIDSRPRGGMFWGKPVKSVDEIIDWSEYYIVIVISSAVETFKIQKYLERKGMHNGKDFCTYREIFSCTQPTVEESVEYIKNYTKEHPDIMNSVMLITQLVDFRSFRTFLQQYLKNRKNHVIFTNLKVLSSEKATKKYNCTVFYFPKIGSANNRKEKELTSEEYNWLMELENRKFSDDREKDFNDSIELYSYYKAVIKYLKPSKIIVWGNWNRESYILGYLADFYNIPHSYLEYGWVPGTYQRDPRGISGQSEYAVTPRMFDKIQIDNIYDIEQIKQYVITRKLDTRTFTETEKDYAALSRIDKTKKTVFLVGMDDCGMKMNPEDVYWKTYISNVVSSSEEALRLLAGLCKKNNWNLVYKPHPGNPIPLLDKSFEDVIFIQDMQIDKLIEKADVVVSITSAVDYKALMYGRPLVQLGITTLLGKDCTYFVSEKGLLEEQLIMALSNGMTHKQVENFDRLLQILLQRYLWDDMSERTMRYGLSIEHDF